MGKDVNLKKTAVGNTIMLVSGDLKLEVEAPVLTEGHPLKILLIGDTVKDVSTTNTDFAKYLHLRCIVERIEEVHIYAKKKEEVKRVG